MDIYGKTVQDRVEKALQEVKEQQSHLEKRGRAGSLQGQETYLHTLEPASMTRQVISVVVVITYYYVLIYLNNYTLGRLENFYVGKC